MQDHRNRCRMLKAGGRVDKEERIVSITAVRDAKEKECRQGDGDRVIKRVRLYSPKLDSELRAIDALSDRKGPEPLDPKDWKNSK